MALEDFTCFEFSPLAGPQPAMCSQNFFIHGKVKGIRTITYIDGGIVAYKSESQCCEHRDMVVSDLERADLFLM